MGFQSVMGLQSMVPKCIYAGVSPELLAPRIKARRDSMSVAPLEVRQGLEKLS